MLYAIVCYTVATVRTHTEADMNEQQLVAVGGKAWTSKDGTKHRVYFNALDRWYGLQYTTYNTGNVASATLDGQHLSNSDARRILVATQCGKLWYDLDRQTWASRDLDSHYDPNIAQVIVERIEAKVAALTEVA